jgi:dolichol kinase
VTLLVHESLGASALFFLFLFVTVIAEVCIRNGVLAPESARKTIHLAGGLGCALFPLLVDSWITVLALSASFSVLLFVGERQHLLKSLSAVERRSWGSLLFPMAILLLFVLARGRFWLYLSALLVLVLADAAAALVGKRFGSIRYQTAPDEWKTLEGTIAFCGVGFLAVFLPLWLLSDMAVLTCLLTALLMAVLLAGLEAVSIGGTDNMFVPVATLYLLGKLPDKPHIEITFQCLSLIVIAWGLFELNRRYQTLQIRPLIVFTLITYAAWALGSIDWMLPAFSGFVIYGRLCSHCPARPSDWGALRLLRPFYPALFILFWANTTLRHSFWLGPYLAATSVATTLCVVERCRSETGESSLGSGRLAAALSLPVVVPCLLCLPIQGPHVLIAIPVMLPLLLVTYWLDIAMARLSPPVYVWRYGIGVCAGLAATAYAGLQHFGGLASLDPYTWKEVFRWQ